MHYLSRIDISYNELQGPIPNSTAFKHAHMEGNKGLCGNVNGLPSYKAFTMHKQASRKKWFVIMFSSLVMGVLLTCLIGFRVLFRQRKDLEKQWRSFVKCKASKIAINVNVWLEKSCRCWTLSSCLFFLEDENSFFLAKTILIFNARRMLPLIFSINKIIHQIHALKWPTYIPSVVNFIFSTSHQKKNVLNRQIDKIKT